MLHSLFSTLGRGGRARRSLRAAGLLAGGALTAGLPWGCSVDQPSERAAESVATQASALTSSYAICGATQQTVSGVPWDRCAALDTPCMRGAWDSSSQCCHLVPRPLNTSCASGACNGFGQCEAPANPTDRDGDGVLDTADPILGKAGWIQAYGEGDPSFWYDIYAKDQIELRISDEPVAMVPTVPQIDLSAVELAVWPSPSERHGVFITAPTAWSEVTLDSGEQFEVCFSQSSADPNAPLPADCNAPGVRRLRCPATLDDGATCSYDDGILKLRAPALRYAWLPIDGQSEDIRLLGLPFRFPVLPCARCTDTPGNLPPPMLNLEFCNGIDDNGDGRVDENGGAICDDNLNCTLDSCQGAQGCVNTPRNNGRFCSAGPDCMELRCNEPFAAGANQDATSEPDQNGCYQLLKHDFCSNSWDGCACNGVERCSPSFAPQVSGADPWANNQGCVAATLPSQVPCELMNGDGDACSIEPCCEAWSPGTCRIHRAIEEQGQAAVDAYQNGCALATGPSNGTLKCPDLPLGVELPYGAHCNDGNPCNEDVCIPSTGACVHPSLPDGDQPGCGGSIGKGCGSQECRNGACRLNAETPDPTDPLQCNGYAAVGLGSVIVPTCLRNECSGTRCNQVPEPVHCDNGLFCDGVELCSAARLAEQGQNDGHDGIAPASLPSPGAHWGCGPAPTAACDDGVGCTQDVCNEASDSCENAPNDSICHAARGLAYSVCAPEFRCNCSGPGCGPPEADGCSALPDAYSPCDDGNICTTDSCKCADEFCTEALCRHRNFCGSGGSGGIGGIGGISGSGGFGNFGGIGGSGAVVGAGGSWGGWGG